jgi:hypothetical protein
MIKIKQNAEQVELVRAMGSKDKLTSQAAQESFAAAIGPVIGTVLDQAGTASAIFENWGFTGDDAPSFPLDSFFGEGAGLITTWSNTSIAGGLPSSQIESAGDMKLTVYILESAVNFRKQYARKSNFNVLSMAVGRMVNEVLVKQERQAWSCLLRALGEARTDSADHILLATTQNVLQIDDFNRLLTLGKRLNRSYAGGTPVGIVSAGTTDFYMSPEMKEQIRGFAYQPMNTRAVPNTDESTALGLPDAVREEIYRGAGDTAIFGKNITELNELGLTYKYNVLFNQYAPAGIAASAANFSPTTDELVLGLDLSLGVFIRPVETDSDTGSTVDVQSDDQFYNRSDKVGYWLRLNEGRVVLEGKALVGLIV